MGDLIYGRNPVLEALKGERTFEKLVMQKNAEGSAKKIVQLARERKIPVQYVDKAALDRLCGAAHQGTAAYVSEYRYASLEELIDRAEGSAEAPFLLILDGIQDPHNLGAILRSADGAGVQGVIIPDRRAVGVTETVAKISAGAVEHVPVARVTNLVQAVNRLKEQGYWIAAGDMGGGAYCEANLTGSIALIVGGEDRGVSRLLREAADYVLSIPMAGKLSSLNASNAAAVMLFEIRRQRGGR